MAEPIDIGEMIARDRYDAIEGEETTTTLGPDRHESTVMVTFPDGTQRAGTLLGEICHNGDEGWVEWRIVIEGSEPDRCPAWNHDDPDASYRCDQPYGHRYSHTATTVGLVWDI